MNFDLLVRYARARTCTNGNALNGLVRALIGLVGGFELFKIWTRAYGHCLLHLFTYDLKSLCTKFDDNMIDDFKDIIDYVKSEEKNNGA